MGGSAGTAPSTKGPYFLAVNFQQFPEFPDADERCEWWGGPPGSQTYRIDGDRLYQFNMQIPVDALKSNEWPYNDDYRFSNSPWAAPSTVVPGG